MTVQVQLLTMETYIWDFKTNTSSDLKILGIDIHLGPPLEQFLDILTVFRDRYMV